MSKIFLKLLHDGHLIGVLYKPEKQIQLDFLTDRKRLIKVLLKGVVRFIGNNLLEGNVVSSALSTRHGKVDTNAAFEYFKDAYESHAGRSNNIFGKGTHFYN